MLLGLLADHWQRKFFLTLVIADEAATTISEFDQDLHIARIKGSRSCCKYINATYIVMAIRAGLPCPITNPLPIEVQTAILAANFSMRRDEYGMGWIRAYRKREKEKILS